MKNLKNIFAKTLLLFSVLLVLSSCKKDKDTKPEDSFDPTKYYITGEGADSYSTSYAFILNPMQWVISLHGVEVKMVLLIINMKMAL